MAEYKIGNGQISILVDTLGAELKSLVDESKQREYMWSADSKFWGRSSPILFPIVGALNHEVYIYKNKKYKMPQHGFARDMDFKLFEKTESSLSFSLESNLKTLEVYPFSFLLIAGFEITDRCVKVTWNVQNKGDEQMHFSIGGHPAFMCPLEKNEKQWDYSISFDTQKTIISSPINNIGLASNEKTEYQLNHGILPISKDLFDNGALIIEHNQSHCVGLKNAAGENYLSVSFEAPLFGIWSPAKKEAPFVCIEPWYGRGDKSDFTGEIKDREWNNQLEPGEIFNASYIITI